jgi:hypothetical protein
MLTTKIKRRIAYAVLMFTFAALARFLVDFWFPEEVEA